MTGQKADVILCMLIHAPSFWDNIEDVFVVFLQTRLLIGHIGISIKDLCPPAWYRPHSSLCPMRSLSASSSSGVILCRNGNRSESFHKPSAPPLNNNAFWICDRSVYPVQTFVAYVRRFGEFGAGKRIIIHAAF